MDPLNRGGSGVNGFVTLEWRHNGHDSVSNHRPHDCLLNRLSRRRSKKTPKLRVNGLCAGTSPGAGEFPAEMASNAENVSIWWRHHEFNSENTSPWYHMVQRNLHNIGSGNGFSLMPPSDYLMLNSVIADKFQWHSPVTNFTGNSQDIHFKNVFVCIFELPQCLSGPIN